MNGQDYALVIMAAGIGARFKGGVKQLQQVGPCGESLMEYAVYDALQAGFKRIILIIRKDIEEMFENMVGKKVRVYCENRGATVEYIHQELDDLPEGFSAGKRAKPWGTGHALLCCKHMLNMPFVVINADDYYGKAAFAKMADFLKKLPDGSKGTYGLAGYLLANTLSDFGGVTRGVCQTDEKENLIYICETRNIRKHGQDGITNVDGQDIVLPGNTPVSMNMWAFTPDILDRLETEFVQFLSNHQDDCTEGEFLIPSEIGKLLKAGTIDVQVIGTDDKWFGLTFREDTPVAQDALKTMTEENKYPSPLLKA